MYISLTSLVSDQEPSVAVEEAISQWTVTQVLEEVRLQNLQNETDYYTLVHTAYYAHVADGHIHTPTPPQQHTNTHSSAL